MAKIYTKTGDQGETGLWGGARVSKNHPRVRAYGEVDELNSVLGAALAFLPNSKTFDPLKHPLHRIQEELFVLGTLLATPETHVNRLPAPFDQGIPAESISWMESEIDRLTAELTPLKQFILPGGSQGGAFLHIARTVCRRAERAAIELSSHESTTNNAVIYLNRLSDYLFTAARWTNRKLKQPETAWEGPAARANKSKKYE